MSTDALHVVIPAHQEEALLGRQLRAVCEAVREVETVRPRVRTSVTVVLDACDDGSAHIARRFREVTTIERRLRCVGAARSLGVDRARRHGHARPERTWVACTDADSRVPRDWLVSQLELAGHGADLVLGVVNPDDGALSEQSHATWLRRHRLEDGHVHVFGANLGVRLSSYDAVGGFRPIASGEDVDLVERMMRAGARVVGTARAPVLTSSRLSGRAENGFASYLLGL